LSRVPVSTRSKSYLVLHSFDYLESEFSTHVPNAASFEDVGLCSHEHVSRTLDVRNINCFGSSRFEAQNDAKVPEYSVENLA